MAKPFSVQCPNCDARLKIQNPQAVGKKVRCPNCQNPFTVEAPRTRPPKDDFGLEDDYDDDFGGPSNNDDDYDDDFGPPRSSSRRPSASRPSSKKAGRTTKTKKKSRKKSNNKTPLLIGGGVAAFLLLVGLGFLIYNVAGGGGGGVNTADLAWMHPNSQAVVSIDVDEAWNSQIVQRIVNHPDAGQLKTQIEEMKKEMVKAGFEPGESIDAIDSVTLGFEKAGQDPLSVVRKKTAWNKEAIKSIEGYEEQTHEEKTYYKRFSKAIYFPDEKTMILGDEDKVKDAMTRGPTSSDLAGKFAFLPKGHIVMGGFPENLAELKQNMKPQGMAGMMLGSKPYLQQIIDGVQGVEGGGLGLTFGSGVELEIVAKCESSDSAGKISGGLSDMLADAKLELGNNRDQLNQMPPPMKDGIEIVEMLLNSMDAGKSGDTATFSLEVTSAMIDKGEAIAKQAGAQGGMPGMPGMPKIPGFDFGKMFGGGGGGAMGNARDAAQRAQDMNNLKQIGLAFHNYHDTYGKFPGGGQSQLSWRVHLLPYLEHQALYNQFRQNEAWNSPHNMTLLHQMPNIYKKPGSNAGPGKTNYVGIDGQGGVMENGGGKRIPDIIDGTSNTILVTEVLDSAAVTWTQPKDYRYTDASHPMRDLGGWTGGFNALLCDGSVRFIAKTINPQTLVNLFRMNDGNPINDF